MRKFNLCLAFFFLGFVPTLGAKSQSLIELYPPVLRKGESVILRVRAKAKPKVRLGTALIPMYLDEDGSFLGFLALDIQDGRSEDFLEIREGSKVSVKTLKFQKAVYRTRRFTIPAPKAKYVGPSKEKEEANKTVARARQTNIQELLIEGPFISPLKEARIGDLYFGDYREIKSGEKTIRYFHRGVDFGAPRGTPVYACNGGVVRLARDVFNRGKTVILDHGWGISTEYLHLDRIQVREGDRLIKGQKLGEVGNTGVSTGPHLHLSFLVNNVHVSPVFWMRPIVRQIFPENSLLSMKAGQ